jgi:ABC-type dipeptide/oligopeptide/nickel transport system permease subunit
MLAGYFRGWVDEVISWIVDVQLAFPVIALAVAIIAVLGSSITNLALVLATTSWPTMARVARAQTLSVRQEPYSEAAISIGAPVIRLILCHIFPNILSPMLAIVSFEMARLVLAESALSFLGLGVSAPNITWGGMIGDGRAYIYSSWWTALMPGVMITALVVALNFIGDGVRDALDPRARTRAR